MLAATVVLAPNASAAVPANTVLPAVSGIAQNTNTLSVTNGTWTNAPTGYTYQWQRCDAAGASCVAIAGATSNFYGVTASDVGHTMRAAVTATNASGSATATSAQTAAAVVWGTWPIKQPVGAANDAAIGTVAWVAPASGRVWDAVYTTATLASQTSNYLLFTNFTFSIPAGAMITGVSATVSRLTSLGTAQIQDASVRLIKGGTVTGTEHARADLWPTVNTRTSYGNESDMWATTLTSADVNSTTFGLAVAAKNLNATSAQAKFDGLTMSVAYTTGGATNPPVNTALPAISGTPQQGQTLTSSTGTWTNSPTAYAYAWQRCDSAGASCVPISGATSSNYVLVSGDVGATIRVIVTASNSAGSGSATSAATAVVTPPSGGAPVNTVLPVISGRAQQGNTLTSSTGSWTNAPTSYTYVWQRCNTAGASCVAIPGAVSSSYVLVASDVGATIRVVVTAHNASGIGSAASAATGVVTPTGGGASSITAVNYDYQVIASAAAPFFTEWPGAWVAPNGSIYADWVQSTGSASLVGMAPAWVKSSTGYAGGGYDHWALTNTRQYRQLNLATNVWSVVNPLGSTDTLLTPVNNSATLPSCVSTGATAGAGCPDTEPTAFSAQADIQLNDGTIIRRVNGDDIQYDKGVGATAVIQRLAPGATQWSAPQYLLEPDPAKPGYCTCIYQLSRIRQLTDGRLIALGQKWSVAPGTSPKPHASATHLLMVSSDNGLTWTNGLSLGGATAPYVNEWDVAETSNGNLLAVFRTDAGVPMEASLVKSGAGWIMTNVTTTPFPHSGHPELLRTASGPILYLSTDGIWYQTDANAAAGNEVWVKLPFNSSPDIGSKCSPVAGGKYNCITSYYPRSVQTAADGSIVVISFNSSDAQYTATLNQSVIAQRFSLTTP